MTNPGFAIAHDEQRVYARNLEVPSGGAVGTARAIARAYGVFATGGREVWKTITAPDPAGITGVAPAIVVMDGKSYAYGVTRILSSLYLVDGLK